MWNGSKEIRVGNSVWQRRGVCPIADCQHVEMLGEWSYWFCFIGAGRAYRRGIETSIYSICNLFNQVLQYFKRNKKQSVIYYLKLQQWVPFCHSGHIWWTPSWLRQPYTGCWYRGSEGHTLEALFYPGWLCWWPTQQLFTNRTNNH